MKSSHAAVVLEPNFKCIHSHVSQQGMDLHMRLSLACPVLPSLFHSYLSFFIVIFLVQFYNAAQSIGTKFFISWAIQPRH